MKLALMRHRYHSPPFFFFALKKVPEKDLAAKKVVLQLLQFSCLGAL